MTGGPDTASFRVTLARGRGHAVLRLSGELDFGTAPQFAQAVNEVLADPPRSVTVDASGLLFADLVGLRPLFTLADRMPTGTVRLRAARRPVARVLKLLEREDLLA